jgi:hypothetical protein
MAINSFSVLINGSSSSRPLARITYLCPISFSSLVLRSSQGSSLEKRALDSYNAWSARAQVVNLSKSSIFFSTNSSATLIAVVSSFLPS